MRSAAVALLLLLAAGARAGTDDVLFAERADTYQVTWKGIQLGRGTISLLPLEANCYRYQSTTRPMALVRWTYGSPRETSDFCVDNGRIVPRHFEYVNDKREKDNFTLDFDWTSRTVKTIKGGDVRMRELPERGFDRFLLQLAVRQWVIAHAGDPGSPQADFTMVDDDRIKVYRFAIAGREVLDLPAGRFDTLRVERIDNPEKSSRIWVAPDRAFMPVKIEHIEKGEVQLRMELSS